jgi:hypothetical protein
MASFVPITNETDNRSEDLKRRFLKAATDLHHLGKSAGYTIIPTTNVSLPLFSALEYSKQLQAVEILEKSRDIYESMIKRQQDIRNPSLVVWAAFRYLNLVPPANFFDKFGEEDVIQIYTKDNYHLFANFRFFELCSYTLEQVYSLPWTELWYRDAEALADLMAVIAGALGPDQTDAISFNKPTHIVRELASPFKYELNYAVRGIAPVWEKKPFRKAGFMIVEHGEILNRRAPAQQEQMLNEFYRNVNDNLMQL